MPAPKVVLVTGASGGFGASPRAPSRRRATSCTPAVNDRIRAEFHRRIGIDELLTAHASL
jgi:hypothetical protein